MKQAMKWKVTRGTGENTCEHFLWPLLTSEVLWEAFHHLSRDLCVSPTRPSGTNLA